MRAHQSEVASSVPDHFYWLFSMIILLGAIWSSLGHANGCPELLRHSFPSLQTGKPQNLCQYQGKVILVVNTASHCGFTDQYDGLEDLFRKYKTQGFVVLGFPSNDFGNQEPGTNKQIAKFCRLTYSVEFPMFEKSIVSGDKRSRLFAELDRRTGQAPRWNFHKYLIDRTGSRVLSFESAVTPEDNRLTTALREMLAKPGWQSESPLGQLKE
jgi:glutathione peroxidase